MAGSWRAQKARNVVVMLPPDPIARIRIMAKVYVLPAASSDNPICSNCRTMKACCSRRRIMGLRNVTVVARAGPRRLSIYIASSMGDTDRCIGADAALRYRAA
jgi:hypothetical protein